MLRSQDLLFCQSGALAINKPPGLLAQPRGAGAAAPYVLAAVAALLAELKLPRGDLSLVHRLDKDTSGVLLLALNKAKAGFLAGEFRAQRVGKEYLALCHGLPPAATFSDATPLSRIEHASGKVRPASTGGRAALTHFEVLQASSEHALALLRCRPQTGRSHQIRVHLQQHGLYLVGDKLYQPAQPLLPSAAGFDVAAGFHCLHAAQLTFHPSPRQPACTVTAPLPPHFAAMLARLKWSL